jgi:SAM-dependent methyltransferase
MEASGPNTEQITYWNEVSGPKWVSLGDTINGLIEGLGEAALNAAAPTSGEAVIDVGCGCGQTSLALARRVGPKGRVLGIDISAPMLADARRRAGVAEADNVEFIQADAQTFELEAASADLLFSRFGIMFFQSPANAFANLRRALRPGGRLNFICWQEMARNPWMALPAQAAAAHVELPAPPESGTPGPYAFADPTRVKGILEAAGYADVAVEEFETEIDVMGPRTPEQTVEFLMQMGPAAKMLAEATQDIRRAAAEAIHAALMPHIRPDGIRLGAATWIVSARRGE